MVIEGGEGCCATSDADACDNASAVRLEAYPDPDRDAQGGDGLPNASSADD
jgi:hypothetical protein